MLMKSVEDSRKHLLVARTLIKASRTALISDANIAPMEMTYRKKRRSIDDVFVK